MEKLETAQIFGVLSAAYPNWNVEAITVDLWHDLLGDLEGNLVKSAVKAWAMTEKWPPTIADVRRLAAEMSGCLPPAPEEAWGEVMAHMRRGGKPEWSHHAITQTVNSIGYTEISRTTNIDVMRAHFTKAYEGYRSRSDRQVLVSPSLSAGGQQIVLQGIIKQIGIASET